jgi:DNA-binding NtrC family response regulator
MFIKTGQIVHDRKRPMPKSVAIVVGPGRVDGQFRICRWRGGSQHWGLPVEIGEEQLMAVADWTELPLTEAKRLATAAFERNYLVRAMEMARGSATSAARAAGIDRTNFRRLLQRHGLVKIATRLKRRKKGGGK